MSQLTSQFSRPINATLSFPNRETLHGRYEYLDRTHYFFAEDQVFLCEFGQVDFVRIHPLDTSVKTPLSNLHVDMEFLKPLPVGSNFDGKSTA